MCLKEGSKVGDTVPSVAGHAGVVRSVSSTSPLCPNPATPVQANVDFTFTFQPKAKIELPEDYEPKQLTDAQKFQGTFLIATSKNARNIGINVNIRKRTPNLDPAALANAVYQAQIKNLEDGDFKNPEQTKINGFDAWNIEVSGKTKGAFGQKITFYITVLDSKDELLVLNQFAPEAEFAKYKSEFISLERKITGLEYSQNNGSGTSVITAAQKTSENQAPAQVTTQKNDGVSIDSNKNQQMKVDSVNEKIILANRRALVVGNDSYKTVAKLANAREDAKTIASSLTSVGYQVTLKLDLTEKEMKAALRIFAAQVQGGDEVVFFFAGHGVQLGAANYLLPTDVVGDSESQVRDEAIQLQRVLDDMSERKAKFTLAMIDACRDNPFKTSGRAIGGRGLAPTTAATGQMVIFSAGTGQQALDKLGPNDKNKNGVFTRIFVQEMQKPDQSVDRVVKNVRNQVAELAKSVGHEQVPAIYDQVLGDFYFKK
jgi:hypothetical protein